MSASTYCAAKALPEGSNLYYAHLYELEQFRPVVIGVHALLQELNDVLLECSDPGIARIKFRWWQEELGRLQQQQARHPVSTYLQEKVRPGAAEISHLCEATAGFEALLMPDQPIDYEDCLGLFKRAAGQGWLSCALLNGIHADSALENIERMGAAYSLLQSLQQPARFMTESCCVVPANLISQSELAAAKQEQTNPRALVELLQRLIATLEETFQNAAKEEKTRFKHGLLLNRLALATAQEIVKSDSQLLAMRVSLTPVRKLLLAWRYQWWLR